MLRQNLLNMECKHFKVISPEQWDEIVNGFKLPEKWCVKVTRENAVILGEFYSKYVWNGYINAIPSYFIGDYMHSHNLGNGESVFSKDVNAYFSSKHIKEGFTKITFEQFKKYVLKQDNMENKEIIGYKLLKDLPLTLKGSIFEWNDEYNQWDSDVNSERDGYTFSQEDIDKSPDWFEPIYEKEFKVGDWVVCTSDNYIGKICRPCDTFKDCWNIGLDEKDGDHDSCHIKYLRKATQEEIEKATRPKELYFGKVKFIIHRDLGYCMTNYGKVTKEELENAISYIENPPKLAGHGLSIHNSDRDARSFYNIHDIGLSIGFGCKSGKLSELKEILKALI